MRAVTLLFHDVYLTDPSESGFRSSAADRYKLSLAAFDAQLGALAAVREDAPLLVSDLVDRGRGRDRRDSTQRSQRSGDRKEAALASLRSLRLAPRRPSPALRSGPREAHPFIITFDDGGVSYYTLAADRLERRGWRGHCFVSTDFIGTPGFLDAAQIRELDARGHVIGSHSASHPTRFSACAFERMVEEWSRSRRVLEDLLGRAVQVASVPGGYFSASVARAAAEAGITSLFTSEPITTISQQSACALIGRYTIRRGDASDLARRFVVPSSWARSTAWTAWNAKGLIKPLLGPSYIHLADWLCWLRRNAEGAEVGLPRRSAEGAKAGRSS